MEGSLRSRWPLFSFAWFSFSRFQLTTTLLLYRWMMIQVLLVAWMWQEPPCLSPSQGPTYSNQRSFRDPPCICNHFSTFSFEGLGIIASSTLLQRRSPAPQPPLLLQSLLMAQSAHWERWQTNHQNHSWWNVQHTEEGSLWAVVLFFITNIPPIYGSLMILVFFHNLLN